jgi:DNA-binding MarR family transcriptional regulator
LLLDDINEIIELLKKWSEFKSLNQNLGTQQFGLWLSEAENNPQPSKYSPILKSGKALTVEYSNAMQFMASYFITRMGKFIKIYTKEIFNEFGLTGSDDFSFLALIDKMDMPNKKELCEANITEITTGLDIIRKLIKNGYVEEIQDNSDKRAKKMKITAKGRETVNQIYLKLKNLSQDVLGDLNEEERFVIIRLLEKLNNYHTPIVMKK